jgi:hypothetical protein
MTLGAAVPAHTGSPVNVLQPGDSFKVSRIATRPHPAEVIKLQPRWDLPDEVLVHHPMHQERLLSVYIGRSSIDRAVAIGGT